MVLILHNFITPIMMSPRGSHITKSSNHIMRTRMVVAEYLLHSTSAFRELLKLRHVQLFDISTKLCRFLLRNQRTCIQMSSMFLYQQLKDIQCFFPVIIICFCPRPRECNQEPVSNNVFGGPSRLVSPFACLSNFKI